MMTNHTKIIIAVVLVVIAVSGRLLPHAWNFTPLIAVSLFAGVYLGRQYAIAVPLVAMIVSDLFLGFYDWQLMMAVYGSFALAGAIGWVIKKWKSPGMVVAASICASTLFFLVTNWAVWQFSPWYLHTFDGLIQSYTLGLPFFRNMLVGDLFYTTALFGVYEFALFAVRRRQHARSMVVCR